MGHFVQGTRVLLGPELTERVLTSGELRWPLLARGVENRKNCVRSPLLAWLFSFRSRRLPGVKTCNFAFWREDAPGLSTADEEFVGWDGRTEFTARLLNTGVRRQNLKFCALGYHLHHSMNERTGWPSTISSSGGPSTRSLPVRAGVDQYLG